MAPRDKTGYEFGTFKGVFTPSILTILGVVMYLRVGWVLGNVGLPTTLVIVTLATSITFLTGLSLSALATNMRVGAGGAYFIISRSLGLEPGAAVGLPLYLAQALGIAFYVAGFSESLVQVFPHLDPRTVGVVTLVALTGLVYVSADLALKSQFVIMAAIAFSLVSFFAGGRAEPLAAPPGAEPLTTLSFWAVFAVFFPAVTGIEAGIAMSGDLKNPARSLPRGTILAILTGYVVYLAIPLALAARVGDQRTLLQDPLVMQRVARWGDAILVGVWAASLSSAMGALLGAPRTLQALARDRVVPSLLARGYGKGNDPHPATALSFAVGLVGILLGDLNVIAPVLSMFFLTSYGVLNLSAGMEELVQSPSWRPRFRIPAAVALAGFVACLGVMLMIAPGATIVAALVCAAIYYVMKRRSLRARWGDMRLGLMMFGVRHLLHRLAGKRMDERSWKPNLLVLSGSPAARWYLIELADAIAQGRSFVTVAAVVPEEGFTTERARKLTATIREYLQARGVPAFIRTLPAPDPFAGAAALVRTYGFGPIVPNTVLVGETEKPASFLEFARLIRVIARTHRNLVILRENVEKRPPEAAGDGAAATDTEERRIDVWWGGLSPNMWFMLALAFLLGKSREWEGARLRLRMIVEAPDDEKAAVGKLTSFLETARIPAQVDVLVRGDRPRFEVICRASADAAIVFLGMKPPAADQTPEDYSRYYEELLRQTNALPATALVTANEEVDFRSIFGGR